MQTHRRLPCRPHLALAVAITLFLAVALTACDNGSATGAANTPGAVPLNVQIQNSRLLLGVNRISIALFTGKASPVQGASAQTDIDGPDGRVTETRPLEFV